MKQWFVFIGASGPPTEARLDLCQYLEGWYNPHRRHSALGNRSPINYERLMLAQAA